MSLRQRSGTERLLLCCLITVPNTYLCAFTYQVVCSGVYVPPYLTILRGNITSLHHKDTHTRSERAPSVMRSGKSKPERPQHCAQKAQKWGSKEGWGRENEMLVQMSSDCLETSDILFPRLTLVLQLVLFPTVHCLPWCFLWWRAQATCLCMPEQSPLISSPNVCKSWLKFSFCLCKFCLFGWCLVCLSRSLRDYRNTI